MKRLKSLIAGSLLFLLPQAEADTTFRAELLRDLNNDINLVRMTLISDLPQKISGFGFIDFSNDSFYSEASLGREFYKGAGSKIEWNVGTGLENTFRIGPEYIPVVHNNLFLDFKLYPLNIVGSEIDQSGQLSFFGRWDIARGFYLENWTDINFLYREALENKKRMSISTETTFGKLLFSKLSVEAQFGYNVNVPNKIEARVGFRY